MGIENGERSPSQIVGEVKSQLERLERLSAYEGNDRLVVWTKYLEDREANKSKDIRFSTGFPELDFCLEGVQTGELIIVSGLTGNGKTLFVKTLIRNMSINEIPSSVFSYEVQTQEFLRAYSESQHFNAKLYVPMELKSGYMPWVEERVLEAKVKYDNKVVLIDHLHYVVDMNTEKMFQNIGAAMRRLKNIAIQMNQVVVVVAHQEKLKDDKEPGIETLRDSSFVGQEADVVIIVHRLPDDANQKGSNRTYDQGYALVKVDKARRAGTFHKRLTFQKQGSWLEAL